MTDYTFYSKTYLLGREAVIDATSFPFWERKASNDVRKYTFGNINENGTIPEVVQLCVCEVAEYLYSCDKNKRNEYLSSEKVGESSESYIDGKTVAQIQQSTIKGIIYNWLAYTNWLYCGVM